jgi:UDP-glucose 4-epimerase
MLYTKKALKEMWDMKILVTGGAGYIASHTNLEILNVGYEVVVVDNLCNSSMESVHRVEKLTGKKISFYEADILNKDALRQIFQKEGIDAVIHFAALKAVGESCMIPLAYFRNNLSGTITLLEVMKEFDVKHLVFSSSATVYGNPEKVPVTEDMPLSATNPYGRTKLMIEEMLQDLYQSDASWNIAILRYFNPIGAHESGEIGEDPNGIPNNLVPYVAKVAIGALEQVQVFGNDYDTPDGTGIRDYIHVVDLALGHIKAIEKLQERPGLVVYNLGTGVGYSVMEIIHNYEIACNKKLPYAVAPRRPGDIAISYADASKAYRELGWKAERGIDKMCEDSYRWQSKYPGGYR